MLLLFHQKSTTIPIEAIDLKGLLKIVKNAEQNPEQRLQCLSEREARASGNVDITITSHLQGRNDDEDDEVFKVVARKRTTKNARPKPCIGSNESECAPKAAQKFSAVFLSGFEASLQSTKIIEHLKDHQLDKHCVCEKMKTRKEKFYSSFRLSVPQDKKDEIMPPSLWPQGIVINHFRNLQRRNYSGPQTVDRGPSGYQRDNIQH
nr:unnamed protein product [Callosobruchus analis]